MAAPASRAVYCGFLDATPKAAKPPTTSIWREMRSAEWRAMACAHLVPHHRGQLCIVLGHLEEAAVDADLAARQGEGIRRVVLNDVELPLVAGILGHGRDSIADRAHASDQILVGRKFAVLEDLLIGVDAHLVRLVVRQQDELVASGDRCGLTSRQDADQQDAEQCPHQAARSGDRSTCAAHRPPLPKNAVRICALF